MSFDPDKLHRFKELQRQLRDIGSPYPDEESSASWSYQLCGKKIISNDPDRAEKSRVMISNLVPFQFQRPPRIYFCRPRNNSLGDYRVVGQPLSPLLTLPSEIRIRIIKEALRTTHEQYLAYSERNTTASWIQSSGLSLVFVCKQLHVEGILIAIKNFTFKESDLPLYTHLRSRGFCLPEDNERVG